MGLSLFKLEKLKITAYRNAARTIPYGLPFEAMFNPASYSERHAIKWGRRQGVNSSAPQLAYTYTEPSDLKLELILDGTGVDSIGLLTFFSKSVKTRIQDFMDVALRYNGSIHEPNYLLVEWGSLQFSCRLGSADIKYTVFDRDGTPLRAELSLSLISDIEAKKRAKLEGKTSPDLTHSRTVRSGDTLPLLTKEIYGSADPYLDVARYNNLDDFRNLIPGQQLLFPPLATFSSGQGGKG